jgi:hypothetical protein
VKLSDLIIEHGPYEAGDVVLASFASMLLDVDDLNELREELMAPRRDTDGDGNPPEVGSRPEPVPVPGGNLSTNSDGTRYACHDGRP